MNRSFRVSVLVLALSLVLTALASATEVEGTTTGSFTLVGSTIS